MFPAVLTRESEHALFAALRSSMHLGHWRVACRRYLMLRAVQAALPASWVDRCEALLERCSDREKQRMLADVEHWMLLLPGVCAARPAVPPPVKRPRSRTLRPRAAVSDTRAKAPEASTAIRTHWRPLPNCFLADHELFPAFLRCLRRGAR